ncbi:MAG: hypothetical protein QOH05_4432 [Acetobacteraceae bacterium]|jgi:hypothetical protein|nr:hypothetical protein [Acetobacteraceae bacterium]
MKIYAALLKSDAEPVLVREGFSWGALILGPFWLAAHRAWIAAAISLAGYILVAALAPWPLLSILTVGLAVILGLTGNDLRRWALEHRGYLLVHVLAARGWDEAWLRLLTHRPDLAVRFRPEPV